jgi:hypothetical protein
VELHTRGQGSPLSLQGPALLPSLCSGPQASQCCALPSGFPDLWLTFLGQLATEVSLYEVISFNSSTDVGCLLGQAGEAQEETTKYTV